MSDKQREALEQECANLAADQCHHGYGDDYGNHRCKYQDDIKALRIERDRYREALRDLYTLVQREADFTYADVFDGKSANQIVSEAYDALYALPPSANVKGEHIKAMNDGFTGDVNKQVLEVLNSTTKKTQLTTHKE